MSPHGDLIDAFKLLAFPAFLAAFWYIWLRHLARAEQVRHNRAVENYNRAILRAIRRLGGCDGTDAVKVDPPTFRPGGLDSPPRRQSSADLCRGRA